MFTGESHAGQWFHLFFFYLHKTNIEYTEHNSSFDYLGVRNILDPDVSEISSQKGLAGLRLLWSQDILKYNFMP